MKNLILLSLFIVSIFFVYSSTKDAPLMQQHQLVAVKTLSDSDIDIYKTCLDSILTSGILNDLNSRKRTILKVSPEFSRSAIINFGKKLDFKSNEEIVVFSKLIDDQNYSTPITKLAAIGKDDYSNFLVQFSKPNDQYITAFVDEIMYKQGNKDYLDEQKAGSIIFHLEEGKIIETYHTVAIYEIF